MKKGKFILKNDNEIVINEIISLSADNSSKFIYENCTYNIKYKSDYFYFEKDSQDNNIIIKLMNNKLESYVYLKNENIQFDIPIKLINFVSTNSGIELVYKIEEDDVIKKVIISC